MIRILFVIFIGFPFVGFAASCPSGFVAVEYDTFVSASSGVCPAGYVAHDIDTVCGAGDVVCWIVEQNRALCDIGISRLMVSTGASFQLYAEKYTEPSLVVSHNDQKCYGKLEQGSVTGAINVKYNGVVYHTVE